MFLWIPYIYQSACQHAGRVYSALYSICGHLSLYFTLPATDIVQRRKIQCTVMILCSNTNWVKFNIPLGNKLDIVEHPFRSITL